MGKSILTQSKKRRSVAILAGLVLVGMVLTIPDHSSAQPDVRLKVSKEQHALLKIAIADSLKDPSVANDHRILIDALKWALEIIGYFSFSNNPKDDPPHAKVAIVTFHSKNSLGFDVTLEDFVSNATIFKRRYGAQSESIISIAYTVADDIIFALTGRRGIADTRLAFVAGNKGESHLYIMNLDGSDLHRLTSQPSIVMSPSWAPDGTRLAFVSYMQGNSDLYVVDISNMATTRFASFPGLNATPSWSPDGKSIAVTLSKDGNPDIYLIPVDGSSIKRITFYSGIDCSPSWGPNGMEIAFTSDRTGSPQIFITDIEGVSIRRITFNGGYNTSPSWSPQGDLIAFVSRIDGRFQICTVDPFGVDVRVLTDAGNNEDPCWSSDGMHIAYSSTVDGKTGIYIMKRDGSNKKLIYGTLPKPRNPAWAGSAGLRTYEEGR